MQASYPPVTPKSRRQLAEIARSFWWPSVALLLASAGCGHTRAALGNRPPNTPEYAQPARVESAKGVVLDMPDPHEAVQDPQAAIELIGRQAMTVEHELRVARGKGDAQTVGCINDKLNQIHAQERMGKEQSKVLDDARAKSDATREHEARVMIGVVRDRAEKLAREAGRCGGRVSSGTSETDVEIERFRAASADPLHLPPAR